MALPTPSDIYAELECYGIDNTVLSEAWITRRQANFIVPWVENKTRIPTSGTRQYTDEYYSGTGSTILVMRRRFISSIEKAELVINNVVISQINVSSIDIVYREGVLKSRRNFEDTAVHPLFPRGTNNIKFDYTVTVPSDVSGMIEESVKYLVCEQVLGSIANRTGGGDLSVQAFSRSMGKRGRWTHIRNDYARNAHSLLSPWFGDVAGQ